MARVTPVVIGLCGLPGAGKSSATAGFSERFDLRVVDRDYIRDAMFPLCAYSDAEKAAANEACMSSVAANCRLGFSTLIDGMTFSSRLQRSEFSTLTRECGGRFAILFFDCPLETARQRLKEQGGHRARDRTPELADDVAARFEPPEGEGLRVDATRDEDEVARQAGDAVGALLEMYRGRS